MTNSRIEAAERAFWNASAPTNGQPWTDLPEVPEIIRASLRKRITAALAAADAIAPPLKITVRERPPFVFEDDPDD